MTVRIYRSSDVGAPVLDLSIGSFNTVLTACLVTGYGSNPSLGWTKEFENLATFTTVYRTAGGNRRYLRVIDTQGANFTCGIRGYESMTDVNTGTKPFPTIAQIADPGLYVYRTSLSFPTPSWTLIGNDRCFYFLPNLSSSTWETGISNTSASGQFFFGDFISYRPGDQYNTAILGIELLNSSTTTGHLGTLGESVGQYICRPFIGSGSSCSFMKSTESSSYGNPITMGYSFDYPAMPDPITGGIPLTRVLVTELIVNSYPTYTATVPINRGYLPGMWAPSVNGLVHGDTFNGESGGQLNAKSFLAVGVYKNSSSVNNGIACFETSDTW